MGIVFQGFPGPESLNQSCKMPNSLPSVSDIIKSHDLRARKSLGQHFLCDMNLTRKIVKAAGNLEGSTVFEIGPGPGGLTRALLESQASTIIAIEKDRRFAQLLQEFAASSAGKLKIIEGDALKIKLGPLASAPRHIVANLPYNVGTELLIGWLHEMELYKSLTLMFQSEVADRICAEPNSKAYGRLSVIAQFCCDVRRVLDVPAAAFCPPPKVDSAVVRLVPRTKAPKDVDLNMLEKVTAHAFGMRRKMLRSSLKPLGGESLLLRADIDPTLRAENLSLTQFEALARLIKPL